MLLDVLTHHLLEYSKGEEKSAPEKTEDTWSSEFQTLLYLVQLPLLQRLCDPLQSLLVRQLRPLFTQTVLNVFGGRLMSVKENQRWHDNTNAAKDNTFFCRCLNLHLGASWGTPSFRGCTKAVGVSWASLEHLSLSWPYSPQGPDVLPCIQTPTSKLDYRHHIRSRCMTNKRHLDKTD